MALPVDDKILKRTKFPPEFSQKVDMKKVNIDIIKKWIAGKVGEVLGSEDDVVTELCFNMLEGSQFPDIKRIQINLTGFLDKDAAPFCKELWTLCLSAQANPQGVPKELLEAKKLELIQEKIKAEKSAEDARRAKEQERTKEKDIESIRQRERGDRLDRGRGRGRGGFRGDRDFDRRRERDRDRGSRSPPRRRRSPPPRRDVDTYIPRGRGGRRDDRRRSRSPPSRRSKSRSMSRSITPPRRRRGVSRSPSPNSPRRRVRSPPRSRSPPRRGNYRRRDSNSRSRSRSRDRGARSSKYGHRSRPSRRSYSPIGRPRSRSPRRTHRRRNTSSASEGIRSPTPRGSHKKQSRRDVSPDLPMSRSRSRSPYSNAKKNDDRQRRSSSLHSSEPKESRADIRKDLNREGRKPRRARSRSDSRSPPRSPSRPRGRSRSQSHSPPRRRRKLPSVERYEPRAKRRRNSPKADEKKNSPTNGRPSSLTETKTSIANNENGRFPNDAEDSDTGS